MAITKHTFNKSNWSGEAQEVAFDTETKSFEMYGYTFTLSGITQLDDGSIASCALMGSDWKEALSLLTVFDPKGDVEVALLEKAVIYVANHV